MNASDVCFYFFPHIAHVLLPVLPLRKNCVLMISKQFVEKKHFGKMERCDDRAVGTLSRIGLSRLSRIVQLRIGRLNSQLVVSNLVNVMTVVTAGFSRVQYYA